MQGADVCSQPTIRDVDAPHSASPVETASSVKSDLSQCSVAVASTSATASTSCTTENNLPRFSDSTDTIATNLTSTDATDSNQQHRRKRKFLPSWVQKWTWLVYDSACDVAKCKTCLKAAELKLFRADKRQDDAFVSRGFRNWDKGPERFKVHEASGFHREGVANLAAVAGNRSVDTKLSAQVAEEQALARDALTTIFTSLRFLATQNIAVRGHAHDDGNFVQLLKLRSEDKRSVRRWLTKRNNWTSDTIQNEILQMFAHDVQRQIVSDIDKSPYIGLICDSTTDSDGLEQFSVTVRYLNADSFTVHEAFLGLYNPSSSTADALTAAIIDVFTRLGIPFSKLRGHSFDGASNMSGRIHGVQAQIRSIQPVSMYVHCVNHSLDLALQEAASDVPIIRNSLSLVKDCANVFRESAKRKQKLKQLSDDISVISADSDTDSGSVFLLALCPTRWCVRSKAVSKILKSWKVIVHALDELKAEVARGDVKCKIDGLYKLMSKMKTYCGVILCQAIFAPCEDLAKALQSEKTTATGAVQASNTLMLHLQNIRTEPEFDKLFSQAERDAAQLGLTMPKTDAVESRRCARQDMRCSRTPAVLITSPTKSDCEVNILRLSIFWLLKLNVVSISQDWHRWSNWRTY